MRQFLITWAKRALVAAAVTVPLGAGAAVSCNDQPDPNMYPVPGTVLLLVPDQGSIGPEGGTDFVLVELQGAGNTQNVVIFVSVKGATASALPGPAFCAADAGPMGGGGAGDAGTGGGKGGSSSSSSGTTTTSTTATTSTTTTSTTTTTTLPPVPPAQADVILPGSALINASRDGGDQTGGFVVTAPSGQTTVELVATAYQIGPGGNPCAPTTAQLLAIGTASITRTQPAEAGAGGAGTGTDGGMSGSGGADAGGTGGSGGADAGGKGGTGGSGGAGGASSADDAGSDSGAGEGG